MEGSQDLLKQLLREMKELKEDVKNTKKLKLKFQKM